MSSSRAEIVAPIAEDIMATKNRKINATGRLDRCSGRYPARRGDKTRVVDIKGMTLLVERCNDDRAPPIG